MGAALQTRLSLQTVRLYLQYIRRHATQTISASKAHPKFRLGDLAEFAIHLGAHMCCKWVLISQDYYLLNECSTSPLSFERHYVQHYTASITWTHSFYQQNCVYDGQYVSVGPH